MLLLLAADDRLHVLALPHNMLSAFVSYWTGIECWNTTHYNHSTVHFNCRLSWERPVVRNGQDAATVSLDCTMVHHLFPFPNLSFPPFPFKTALVYFRYCWYLMTKGLALVLLTGVQKKRYVSGNNSVSPTDSSPPYLVDGYSCSCWL